MTRVRGFFIDNRLGHLDEVANRFGMNCASCHVAADPKFDMVCEQDHGCADLPVGHEVFEIIQELDPRPLA